MEKTTKYLRRTHGESGFTTLGKLYEVTREDDRAYYIISDGDGVVSYTKKPDYSGLSYATWFTLETDADSAPTTVLPDESLGGVLREYREVKRKASVGERVLVTEPEDDAGIHGNYLSGDIAIVTSYDTDDYGTYYCAEMEKGREIQIYAKEYVVLEPTDILRIDGERFCMVERKAAVGERVIVTSIGYKHKPNETLAVGQVGECTRDNQFSDGSIDTTLTHDSWGFLNADRVKYAVLEPLTPAVPTLEPAEPTPLSALPLVDQYAENITVLTRKIAQLEDELRVAREDIVLIEEGVSGEIKALETRILALETDSAPACVEVAPTHVKDALTYAWASVAKAPKTPKEAALSPQDIRDKIVERAKADVSDLRKFSGKQLPNDSVRFWPETKLPHAYISLHSVEFVVNSAKRTVVAIIRCTADGMTTRGIAKCAPGDVFNSHLGRAIALYRALGLEVPAEYLTCPQPTEVRVGDVVLWTNSYDAADTQVFTIASVLSGGYRFVGGEWDGFETVRVIEDSREDGGNSASPSALKGAA